MFQPHLICSLFNIFVSYSNIGSFNVISVNVNKTFHNLEIFKPSVFYRYTIIRKDLPFDVELDLTKTRSIGDQFILKSTLFKSKFSIH